MLSTKSVDNIVNSVSKLFENQGAPEESKGGDAALYPSFKIEEIVRAKA